MGKEPPSDLPDPAELLAPRPRVLPGPDSRPPALARANLISSPPPKPAESFWERLARPFGFTRARRIPLAIGDLLLALRPAPIVVVASRKGGVGKTAVAAAVAQVFGHALGRSAGTAAVVDQNIGNADQWGRLDIPHTAATVRDLMAALSATGALPAAPTWAATPALAVYPESRQAGAGYPPSLVQAFAHQIRTRHAITVVDLPNRLPSQSSAEASLSASWLAVADLVLLPTTDDINALRAAEEYLATASLQGKLVVISHMASSVKALRGDRTVRAALDRLRPRVAAIEAVPKSERATLAVIEGRSILEVDSALRNAYIDLALTCVRSIAWARA